MAMRGINMIAMGVIAELGDLSRFSKPTQLMAYLGLVPSEHSSGPNSQKAAMVTSGAADEPVQTQHGVHR